MRGHLLAGAVLALALLAMPVAAQGPADPVVVEALKEIERYEDLAKTLQPGDRGTANSYIEALNPLGDRLKGVADKQHPQWRDAVRRYNAVQNQITATARKPAATQPATAAPAAPATPAAPAAASLNSSDKARLARVQRSIVSLGQDIDKAAPTALADETERARFTRAAENQTAELAGFPAGHADVAPVQKDLDAVKAKLEQRIAEAKAKMSTLGDVDAQLAEIDRRLQAQKVPAANSFKPEGTVEAAKAFAAALVDQQRQAEADKATLDKIEGGGVRNQTTERLRHWAVVERQRAVAESTRAATQAMDARVATFLRKADFLAPTDPANADHRANRLLGDGKRDEIVAELTAGGAAVETAKAFDAGLDRKGGPDRAAEGRKLAEALTAYEQKYKAALGFSRMPPPGMSDDKYAKIAAETLKQPNYGVGTIRRLVVNSRDVQKKEKKEAEIRPGVVTTTATIYHWVWDEYQVATAEKVGDRSFVFFNTLKFFHQGAPTTPTGRWVLADRFKSVEILEENIDK